MSIGTLIEAARLMEAPSARFLRERPQIDKKIEIIRQVLENTTKNARHCCDQIHVDPILLQKKTEIEARLVKLEESHKRAKIDLPQEQALKNLRSKQASLTQELMLIDQSLEKSQRRQRIYGIDTELLALCGSSQGKKNSLLDRTWQAYKTGRSGIEKYQRLEKRRRDLQEEKTALSTEYSLAHSREISQPARKNLEEVLDQLLQQREKIVAFETSIASWKDEAEGSPEEYETRLLVAERICGCYRLGTAKLDLKGLGLSSLPQRVFGELTQLTDLDVSGNRLEELPEEIVELSRLTTLKAYSNQLRSLPKDIGKLQKLDALDISENNLLELPVGIGELVNLTSLDLSENPLQGLPTTIGDLRNLNSRP
ncbi:MAG: hypothetical protein KGZ39_01160 [Simkania sp.]|nr:hypothetical protein [Simkania sp.]